MTLASDIDRAAREVEALEERFARISVKAYALCRALGYAHGANGAEYVGAPDIEGFVSVEQAVAQLMESLRHVVA